MFVITGVAASLTSSMLSGQLKTTTRKKGVVRWSCYCSTGLLGTYLPWDKGAAAAAAKEVAAAAYRSLIWNLKNFHHSESSAPQRLPLLVLRLPGGSSGQSWTGAVSLERRMRRRRRVGQVRRTWEVDVSAAADQRRYSSPHSRRASPGGARLS